MVTGGAHFGGSHYLYGLLLLNLYLFSGGGSLVFG